MRRSRRRTRRSRSGSSYRFPPGGSTDIVARIVAQKLSDRLGQQVVVENRGGAGGTIGAEAVAKAAPDGYTLVLGTTSTHAVAPNVYARIGYDPVKDFAPISLVAVTPYLLVVQPGREREVAAGVRRLREGAAGQAELPNKRGGAGCAAVVTAGRRAR